LFLTGEFLKRERSGVLPKGRDVIDLAFARTPELKEVEYDYDY